MSVRMGLVLAGVAAAAVAVAVVASADRSERAGRPAAALSSSPGDAAERPRGRRVGCGQRSEADFPGAYSDPDNMRIGPLVFVGGVRVADDPPRVIRKYDGQKLQLLVRAGRVVTVSIPRHAREGARLAYGWMRDGRRRLEDMPHTITFKACRRGRPSGSTANGPVTFWPGLVMVREPGCVPLRAWVDDERRPRRRVMSLGAGRCD
jgi:hypothetical protein